MDTEHKKELQTGTKRRFDVELNFNAVVLIGSVPQLASCT